MATTISTENPKSKSAAAAKSVMARYATKLNQRRPRKEGVGSYEVALTTDKVLPAVRYTVTTGLDPLDTAAGGPLRPGIPMGRITEVFGLDGSGKTALAQLIAARFQQGFIFERTAQGQRRVDPKLVDTTILYVDTEHSLNEGEALEIDGVKLQMLLARCDTLDNFFKIMDDTMALVKETEEETGRPQFLLVVLDTIAGLPTKEELAADWNKDDYPRGPKMLREGFRILMNRISEMRVALVCCNQVGNKVASKGPGPKPPSFGGPSAEDFSPPGGLALRFYARLRIFCAKVKPKYKIVREAPFAQGFVSEFEMVKNSQAPPSRKVRLALLYQTSVNGRGGFSADFSLLETLISLKLAEADEDGGVTFMFSRAGIVPATFGAVAETSLGDLDDAEKPAKKGAKKKRATSTSNPYIDRRHVFPAFRRAHRADFDRLWAYGVEQMFQAVNLDAEATEAEVTMTAEGDGEEDSLDDGLFDREEVSNSL